MSHSYKAGHPDACPYSHGLVEGSKNLLLSDVVKTISGLRFVLPPRKQYQYCNIAIFLIGHIIEAISGASFEDFVKLRILNPLDMRDSTWCYPSPERGVVEGYVTTWKGDRIRQKIGLGSIGLPHNSMSVAASGMLSTAGDMAKWLAFLLRLAKGMGSQADKKILRPETLREIVRSRVVASQQIGALPVTAGESLWPELSVPTYALAQLMGTYRGTNFASHNGRWDEYFCRVHSDHSRNIGTGVGGGTVFLWTPKGDFGICVLTNVLGSVLHAGISIALCALDMHLERPLLDWNERLASTILMVFY